MNLSQRRRELIERSGAQRAALLGAAEPIVRKAASLDRVITQLRRYPILTGLAVVAVALLGPRRIFDWGARALVLYKIFAR